MEQKSMPGFRESSVTQSRYQINPGFLLRRIAGEYAIVPVDGNSGFGNVIMTPNWTAACLWNAFSKPSTEDEVVSEALARFDAPEDIIRKDVRKFVTESLSKQVLWEVK